MSNGHWSGKSVSTRAAVLVRVATASRSGRVWMTSTTTWRAFTSDV